MSKFKFLVVSVALLFCSITVAYSGEVFLPIKGDLDNDGDVDFQDFLIFAGNFGKEGLVSRDLSLISPEERASKMLGEWFFRFGGDGGLGGTAYKWDFMIGVLGYMWDSTEVVYRGYRYNGRPATGYYLKDRDEYSLLYVHDNFTWYFLFAIKEQDRIPRPYTYIPPGTGTVYRFNNTYQTIEDARVLPILERSHKILLTYRDTPLILITICLRPQNPRFINKVSQRMSWSPSINLTA